MGFTDEQVKDMVELKERLMRRVEKYQKEIDLIEKEIGILDSAVKQSSFAKASAMPEGGPAGPEPAEEPGSDAIAITRTGQGTVIANAYVTPAQVSIVVDGSVDIDESTPPFRSFFMERIIESMKSKSAAAGGPAMECQVRKDGQNIREITVSNYGRKDRLDEIISTAGWTMNRMLEKGK